jgi:hypothetical protein
MNPMLAENSALAAPLAASTVAAIKVLVVVFMSFYSGDVCEKKSPDIKQEACQLQKLAYKQIVTIIDLVRMRHAEA